MSSSRPSTPTRYEPLAPESLRRLRHELRTPVNHLLGYTELLLEDTADLAHPWDEHLRRIHEAGQELLTPIGSFLEAMRDATDPSEPITEIRGLIATIGDACELLAKEASRVGAEDAAADLDVIRNAATTLLDLVLAPANSSNTDASAREEPDGTAPPPTEKRELSGTILVVDDNEQNREILTRRLERLGHIVDVASGGQEALALLRAREFDVLLLDVMMPEMDGFEVLARLKADAALRDLPVIMLSALDEVASAVRCIEMGADDYLTKPVDTVLLRARIGACLERKRLRDTELAYLRQAAQVTGPAVIARLLVDADPAGQQDPEETSLREAIACEIEWVDAPKGKTLFADGDPGDSMYVVLSGRLRIDERDERGEPRLVGDARSGGTLGELEMLTGQPRSTTATVVRTARLARIHRTAFERLAAAYPRLLTRTTSDVVHRLRDAFQRRPPIDRVTTFALVPIGDGVDLSDLAHDLTRAIQTHGDAILLDRQTVPQLIGNAASIDHPQSHEADRLSAFLNEIELQHRFVVYRADPELSSWTRSCLRQADHVVLVGQGHPPVGDNGALAEEIARSADGAPVDLLLLHDATTSRPSGTAAWLDRWSVHMHHHLRSGDDLGLARLARRLTGKGIDLVLGGGGARGWAHIGVIRAILEAGIPIDAIAGTSMGAIIGGAHLAGMDWPEMEVEASRWGSPRRLFDFTLPIVSVISGNKMTGMLRSIYGDVCIEDLWRSFFCVSSSLTNAQPVVHRQGPLWHAVRASISLPGFLPPVRQAGELLIDGAYLNNLPTDFARAIYRSGTVIAVSVSESVEMSGEIDTGPAVSGWEVLGRKLLRRSPETTPPSVAAIVMRASSLSGVYNLGSSVQLADLTIIPPVGDFGTLDFASYREVIQTGYEDASRQIEQWQRSIESTSALPSSRSSPLTSSSVRPWL